ncbi:MAG: hypothetical protein FJY81_07340 [Candidatus Aminicenantes bacterium]|nr:hypothetical protein [Candidatus Aminicenantes bacterium]
MQKILKALTAALFVLFLSAAYSTGVSETAVYEESAAHIEVCANGIVYLPPGTRHVTCHGKVMRVLYVVPIRGEMQDCNCPQCCGGLCGITVLCAEVPEPSSSEADCWTCGTATGAGEGGLCTAYLACGD